MKPTCSLPIAALAIPLCLSVANAAEETKPNNSQLDTVTVTASAVTEGYLAPRVAEGALKSEIPLLETPQAVTVISEELIEDRHATKLEEILQYVAGVSTGGIYGTYDQYRIRGFDASYNTFWDGLRGDNGVAPETYGLEKVEVIKGPASTLYGNAPLGGVVNMVSKRPTKETEGEFGVSIGSYSTLEGRADVSTPLYTPGVAGGNSGVYGRIVGLYRTGDSFIDYSEKEKIFVAPSVLFQISDDTKLTFLGSYTHDDYVNGMPLPADGTVRSNPYGSIRRDLYVGIPGEGNHVDFTRLRLGYEFSHRFNDLVSVRQNFNYTNIEQKWDRIFYPPFGGAFDGRNLSLMPYSYQDESDRYGVDTAADFTFDTWNVKHTATVGFDYYRQKGESRAGIGANVNLDIFDPNYNIDVPRPTLGDWSPSGNEIFGFYAQDHANLTDTVTLTFGGRYDSFEDRVSKESESAFSPKVGVTYEFIENVAAYANYSTSFAPQNDPQGRAVDPVKGENYEAGLKYSAFNGKITGMASVFQLTREDAVVPTSMITYALAGEQRSRGFELENSAHLLPGLEITSAYTYLDTEVTEDTTLPVGAALAGIPDHTISLWAKYIIQEGTFKGFGAGLGGRYLTEQAGDANNNFDLPSYGVLDAALYYENEHFSAQLNFKNITDKRYFSGSSSAYYVLPGEPFNVTASATWKF